MSAGDGFDRIPVIDAGPLAGGDEAAIRETASAMRAASETAGFFCISNHGVAEAVTEAAVEASRRFFARPLAEKRRVAVDALHRGYIEMGEATLKDGVESDRKESFVWGLELGPDDPDVAAGKPLMGPNRWPGDMPEMRGALYGWYEAVGACARNVLKGLAVGLGLPADYFEARFAKPLARGSLVRYPPHPADAGPRVFGTVAHTDYGGITLVWQDDSGGLEVENRAGDWVPVHPIPGTLVVNIGDLMARWTNDVFASNPHRVINRSGRERHSMAVFFDPDHDTVIETLPTCLAPDELPGYPPTTCGAYIGERFDAVFRYRSAGRSRAERDAVRRPDRIRLE